MKTLVRSPHARRASRALALGAALSLLGAVTTSACMRGRSNASARPLVHTLSREAQGTVVARVNGEVITADEVAAAGRLAGERDPHRALELAVRDKLLASEARRRGSMHTFEEDAVRRALVQALLVREVDERVTPTSVAPDVYQSARRFFGFDIAHGPTATVMQTVVQLPQGRAPTAAERTEARAIAERLHARVSALAPPQRADQLESLARELCTGVACTTERIGPFDAEARMSGGQDLVASFAAAGIALTEPGQMAAVTETFYGYHVLVLIERGPALELTPEEERAQILSRAVPRLRLQRFDVYMRGLRAQAPLLPTEPVLRTIDTLDLLFAEGAGRAAPPSGPSVEPPRALEEAP